MASSVLVASPVGDRIVQIDHLIRTSGKNPITTPSLSSVESLATDSSLEAIILDLRFGLSELEAICMSLRHTAALDSVAILILIEAESAIEFSKCNSLAELVDDWIVTPFQNREMLLLLDLLSTTLHEDTYLRRKNELLETLSNDISAEESMILRQEKEELIRQIYLVLQQQIRHPMLSILAASEVLKEQFPTTIPAHNIACQIEICAKRIRDILETLGNLKTIVLDDYLYGTTMVDFEKSAAQS